MLDHHDKLAMKTKIIATIGPASATRETLGAMVANGLDLCRLNFSHGDLDGHARSLDLIREAAAEHNQPIAVIGDLAGPKVRLGRFDGDPVTIVPGQLTRIVRGTGECSADRLTTTYPAFVDEVQVGQRIFIDDGLVRLLVVNRTPDELVCECKVGGLLSSRKGVNLPDTMLSTPALTEKDRRDLEWAIERGLDFVALSFVRQPDDLYELKRIIKEHDSNLQVIIKIEKTEALWHIEELIAHTDAVLVARGDLGVESDLWRVPLIQKDIVADCLQAGVPVIVATQMLQSMVDHPLPTRAEVSDVANAILDRADAVMLSGETAVGRHPVAAVDMMNRIAAATEEYLEKRPPHVTQQMLTLTYRPTSAIAHAAVAAARDLGARLVAVWSATGATVRLVAKHRLRIPVVGLTSDPAVWRQMNLLFGVVPIRVDPLDHPAEMAEAVDGHLLRHGLAAPGDLIVVVTSTQPQVPGATDTVVVHRVGEGRGGK
ncbi:MAG: pyruvate kinase [Phycisphaerales bacterium]|nr:pyruvate kinase [Phycisphaerales bacterium]